MTTEKTLTEYELLKQQADQLGIEYKSNISARALKKLVADELAKEDSEERNQSVKELQAEALKLVNIIITPVDNRKKELQGEFFRVGNRVLGMVTKYVPYNTECLVPHILVQQIKATQTLVFKKVHTTNGLTNGMPVEPKNIPAYTVQELPLPTKEELQELARRQSARKSLED